MRITKRSAATGVEHTLDLPISPVQLERFQNGEGFVQDIFPELSADQREFLISGTTAEEWAELFPPDEEDD